MKTHCLHQVVQTQKELTNSEDQQKTYFLEEKRHFISNIFLLWRAEKNTVFTFQMLLEKGGSKQAG